MKLFDCQHCGNAVHFENTICVNCHHRLGYLPTRFVMSAVEPVDGGWRALADPGQTYMFCDNAESDVCNWLVPADGGTTLCEACRHNRLVPDLSIPDNAANWAKLERAKRHLFYSLMRWRLPMPNRIDDPEDGLAFDFVADVSKPDGSVERVLTGHNEGLITINLAEADDPEREARRAALGEPYRTLLGHLRHEVGHYYWDRLVRDSGQLDGFRALFGDERLDYADALRRHYEQGAPPDWRNAFISSYATAHPWEDFAETWAHYVHIVDALETAHAFGLRIRPRNRKSDSLTADLEVEPYFAASAAELVEDWVPLTVAINSLNRSMGQPDLYPFVLSKPVLGKLQYMHDLIHGVGATLPPDQAGADI